MNLITPTDLQAYIGKRITVDVEGGIELWLIESLRLLPSHGLRRDPFALYLVAPETNVAVQGARHSVLPNGEAFDFFAVPIGKRNGEVTYEVIFN